jgi:putative mRNA 3-end processing factor
MLISGIIYYSSLKEANMHTNKWLTIKNKSLYCIPGQFYIDPLHAVDSAIITHGHADHARIGHKKVLATPETLTIMKTRYGADCAGELQALNYHEHLTHKQVKISLLPAGHILGSAQVVLEYQGSRLIISGDYKRAPDPTCLPFAVQPCDVFITEATFGLPVFKHPPIENELNKLLVSLQQFPERCHLVGAYALGKCQRIIKSLRLLNFDQPIYLHGALLKLCELYQNLAIDLGDIRPATQLDNKTSAGKIVLCPPSALHDRWSRRFGETVVSTASGWMQIRARAKQKGIDLPLIISDHADWNELTQTLQDVQANEIWVTHGREEALVYFAEKLALKAHALSLLGYDENHEE